MLKKMKDSSLFFNEMFCLCAPLPLPREEEKVRGGRASLRSVIV